MNLCFVIAYHQKKRRILRLWKRAVTQSIRENSFGLNKHQLILFGQLSLRNVSPGNIIAIGFPTFFQVLRLESNQTWKYIVYHFLSVILIDRNACKD